MEIQLYEGFYRLHRINGVAVFVNNSSKLVENRVSYSQDPVVSICWFLYYIMLFLVTVMPYSFINSNKERQTDSLPALSALFGFLQLLLPSANPAKPDETEKLEPNSTEKTPLIYPQNTRNVNISFAEMKEILDMDKKDTSHVISRIESCLKVIVNNVFIFQPSK